MDIRDISEKLKEQAGSVVRLLLPGGAERNREWEVGSIDGEQGKSLKVCLQGPKRGIWSDFAAGTSGDLIDLWCQVKGITLADALTEIKEWMGIKDPFLAKLGNKTFKRPVRQQSVKKIAEASPVMNYLQSERKIEKATLDAYRISEAKEIGPYENWKRQEPWLGPWIVFPSLRGVELIFCKYLHLERKEGKKQTFVEANCEPCLFGWQAIPESAREVVICEGEIDALTFHQYGYPALSVPFGGGGGNKQQWIDYELANLDRFETVYLSMDNDEAGDEGLNEIINRLGTHRCRVVKLPHKDANECVQKGVPKEVIAQALGESKYRKPEELISFSDLGQSILEEFYPKNGTIPGFKSPWEKMPFTFRRSEMSIWTGVNGHGKSMVLNYLMVHAMMQGEKVCVASLEMPVKKTGYRFIRQIAGQYRPTPEMIKECLEWLDNKAYAFNLVGSAKVDHLIETFRFAYKRYGVRQFIIDSLLKCGLAEDDYTGQKALVEKLCDFVNSTEAHVHLVAHSRKHENEDYQVGKLDIRGSGAISDLAWNCFTVWRNKKKEAVLQEYKETGFINFQIGAGKSKKNLTFDEVKALPDGMVICDKARNEEWEGKIRLFFKGEALQYTEDLYHQATCHLPNDSLDVECPY